MRYKLKCRLCGEEYNNEPKFVCSKCLGPLDVHYEYSELSPEDLEGRPFNMWRYREFLPVDGNVELFSDVGFTPLIKCKRLGEKIGISELYIKNDAVNPTGSFKDRPAAISVLKALEFGFNAVGCSSTGNLAAALSAMANRAGLSSFTIIPDNIEIAKVIQAMVYGSRVIPVKGTYEDANFLCSMLAGEGYGVSNVNLRPYYSEGSKTLIYETIEQLGWNQPRWVVIPMASGALLYATWRGLNDLKASSLIEEVKSSLIGVQPAGCSPIVTAFKKGFKEMPLIANPTTIAKSLAIGNPADGRYALDAIKLSGGIAESVDDELIIKAMKWLAKYEGIFAEPAGGITIAVVSKLIENKVLDRNESVVCFVTGSGFKSMDVFKYEVYKQRTLTAVEPDINLVKKLLP